MTIDLPTLAKSFSQGTFGRDGEDHSFYAFGPRAPYVAIEHIARGKRMAIDIETAGLKEKRWRVKAVSVANAEESAVLDPGPDRRAIKEAIHVARELVFHNAMFDAPILIRAGLMRPEDIAKVTDTAVIGRFAHPGLGGRGLEMLAERYLGKGVAQGKGALKKAMKMLGLTMAEGYEILDLSSPVYRAYAAWDAVLTARIVDPVRSTLNDLLNSNHRDGGFSHRLDVDEMIALQHKVLYVTLGTGWRGLEVDFDAAEDIRIQLGQAAMASKQAMADIGFTFNSGDTSDSIDKIKKQAVVFLQQHNALPPGHKILQDGTASAAKGELEKLGHPLIEHLEQWAVASRFERDYIAGVLQRDVVDGRIYPQANIGQAVSGRMSMSEPNTQQYPPVARGMFAFKDGVSSIDYSQIEPFCLLSVARETALVQHYEEGGDLYERVAQVANVARPSAKSIFLGTMYGLGIPGTAGRLGIDVVQARQVKDAVLGAAPKARDLMEYISNFSTTYGVIQTIGGRIIPVPRATDKFTGKYNGKFKGYIGVNYFVQGSCYDLLADAVARIYDAGLGEAVHVLIHDEIVCATEAADEIDHIMRTPPARFIAVAGRVPKLRTGRVDLGSHWREKE